MAVKGFTERAVDLIQRKPGLTDREYAEWALRDGLAGSDAKNPVMSLAKTLDKQVRDGRESRVIRRREGGKLRFYPASPSLTYGHEIPREPVPVTMRLPAEAVRCLDDLVEMGQ